MCEAKKFTFIPKYSTVAATLDRGKWAMREVLGYMSTISNHGIFLL